MNTAQLRYYAINQWILGKPIESLSADAKEVILGCDVESYWSKTQALPLIEIGDIEKLFLRFLRTNFGICVSAQGTILLLSDLYEFIRSGEVEPSKVVSWAMSTIDIQFVDDTSAYISDCVLYAPKTMRSFDFAAAIERAFTLRAVGALSTDEKILSVVNMLDRIVSPRAEISMSKTAVRDIFKAVWAARVNPVQLSSSALLSCDLESTVRMTGVPCWWADSECMAVNVMLPKGKDNLVLAVLPLNEFVSACGCDFHGLQKLRVHGENIVYED